MQKVILAISGRKQSGKSSTCRYIEQAWGHTDVVVVEEFSFADPLKDMCVKLLGLKPERVRGTDEQKNSPVPHLLWENFPVVEARSRWWWDGDVAKYHSGPMTGREVMQYWGTEVFRRAYPDVWAKAAVQAIDDRAFEFAIENCGDFDRTNTLVAVLPDCRFPNEVQAVKDAGGYVLRLTRNPHPGDTHPSEIALDAENYDWSNFDLVYDNSNQTVPEQMAGLTPWLREIGAIA